VKQAAAGAVDPIKLAYDLEDARCFVEVIRSGGYTSASKVLGIPKSTLSRRLSQLEESLGVQLLRRTTRELSLTSVGKEFYETVSRGLEAMHEAGKLIQRETRDELSGLIRITAPVDFANAQLGRIIVRYRAKYPAVGIELLLTDRVLDLLRDHLDLALRAGAPVLAGSSESVVARRLSSVDFIVVASGSYIKSRGLPSRVEDLARHDGIYFRPEADGLMEWELFSGTRRAKAQPRQAIVVDGLPGVLELALAGCGVALVPESLCRNELESGAMVRLLPAWSGERTSAFLVYPKDKYQPLRVKKLIEEFHHEFKPSAAD
jgi:DNA-binding transcriptional LysR family regulator